MSAPLRRSTRNSASREATPARSTTGDAGRTGETPRRSNRISQPRDLPPIASKSSNAYGGLGKAIIGQALTVDNGQFNLSEQFGAARDRAQEANRQAQGQSSHAGSRPTAIAEEDEDVHDSESDSSYHGGHAGPSTGFGVPFGHSRQPTPARQTVPTTQPSQSAQPASFNESQFGNDTTRLETSRDFLGENHALNGASPSNWPQSAPRSYLNFQLPASFGRRTALASAILLPVLLCLVLTLNNMLAYPATVDYQGSTGVLEVARVHTQASMTSMNDWARSWFSGTDFAQSYALAAQLSRIESQLDKLTTNYELHDNSIRLIHDIMPNNIVVNTDEQGSMEIPDDFWHALKSRCEDELGIAPGISLWNQFLAQNEKQLSRISYDNVESMFQDAKKTHAIIGKKEFSELMKKEVGELRNEYEQSTSQLKWRLEVLDDEHRRSITAKTNAAWRLTTNFLSNVELQMLAAYNLVQNANEALNNMNFVAASLGAIVDPFLTSPTQLRKDSSVYNRIWTSVVGGRRRENPPITALEPWLEPGDCWCAAPNPNKNLRRLNNKGTIMPFAKAQLAIILPHAIYPKSFTIENIPATGTLDARSAPYEVELWVQVADPATREMLYTESISGNENEHEHATLKTWWQKGVDGLDETWVRAGTGRYELTGPNHVQTFPVFRALGDRRVPTRKVVVRATSNHGRDYTCFYRVRVHGKTVEKLDDWFEF